MRITLLLLKPLSLFIVLSLLTDCYYDKLDQLSNASADLCATETTVTYSSSIHLIMSVHCVSCHSNAFSQGNLSLESYAQVKASAASGKLLNTIERNAGYPAMPPTQALPDCQVQKIRDWINSNMPE